jgi:TusA-related sulfurtransferase
MHQKQIAKSARGVLHTNEHTGLSVVEVTQLGTALSVQPTHRLNVIGFFCPVPVSEAKKALSTMNQGEVLELWADDPETLHDLPMLIHRTPHHLISIEEGSGEYRFLVEVAA